MRFIEQADERGKQDTEILSLIIGWQDYAYIHIIGVSRPYRKVFTPELYSFFELLHFFSPLFVVATVPVTSPGQEQAFRCPDQLPDSDMWQGTDRRPGYIPALYVKPAHRQQASLHVSC